MSRYRPIGICIWSDDKFPYASDDCQLVWFHIFTNPLSTPLGLFKASLSGLAEEKNLNGKWPLARYRKAFEEALAKGFLRYDEKTLLIYFPKFFSPKYTGNHPQSPNVVKSWGKIWHELPNCSLKCQCYQDLKDLLQGFGQGFIEAFNEGFGKSFGQPLPIQEQYSGTGSKDQEQEQEQEGGVGGTPEPSRGVTPPGQPLSSNLPRWFQDCLKVSKNFSSLLDQKHAAFWQTMSTAYDPYQWLKWDEEVTKADAWIEANPQRRPRQVARFLRNWFERAVERRRKEQHATSKK